MTPKERDDFAHALGQTLAFYGKELDKQQFSFWMQGLGNKSVDSIKRALVTYTQIGRYAPKPVDILDILAEDAANHRAHLPPPEKPHTPCPPEISAAWIWFNKKILAGTNLDGLFGESKDVDPETAEKYLHIVNHEAFKFNQPDAIPDEYKLREVWG